MTTTRPEWCEGHETLSGPIGETVYCDGTCVSKANRAAHWKSLIEDEQPENGLTQYYRAKLEELDGIEQRP
jgi:hypothetical protein